jgi:hypothetical protein
MYLVGYNENNPSELLFENLSEFQELVTNRNLRKKQVEQRAKDLEITHHSCEDYGAYLLVYYDAGEVPYVEGYGGDYGYDQTREYAPRHSKDFVFVVDTYEGSIENLALPRWERRANVSTAEEAVEYLASFLSSATGLSEDNTKEAEEFAAKWGIPFSGELHNLYVKNWTDCHPAWNSSSAYC